MKLSQKEKEIYLSRINISMQQQYETRKKGELELRPKKIP